MGYDMNFNSYIFILAFLPVVLVGYHLINRMRPSAAKLWLLAASLVFYAYAGAGCLVLLCVSILVNYPLARVLSGKGPSFAVHLPAKGVLTAGILFNVLLLLYFKYTDFFITNLNTIFQQDYALRNLALPLGISFFTFQQIAYLVDSYRGETGQEGFFDYALFVSFFPKIAEGPIVFHSDLIPQFEAAGKQKPHTAIVDYDKIARGIMLFTLGLFKKVMVADTLGRAADWGFSHVTDLTSADVIVVMVAYSFQIYFDFSGYCDMASGVACMLGFTLPVNFNSPYKALTITDFWKRWHISLTTFLRRYIYFPLGGSRKGTARTYLNMMIIFLVSGFWHGANWTFILWGFMHGAGQVLHRMCKGVFDKFFRPVQWFCTFLFVNVAWLLFRADSVSEWWYLLKRMFSFRNMTLHENLVSELKIPKLRSVLSVLHIPYTDLSVYTISMLLFFGACLFLCLVPENNQYREHKINGKTILVVFVLFMTCLLSLSNVTSFLYFNF